MNRLFLGDSRDVLRAIPADSVDLIITSPPYKDSDGYTPELMREVFQEAFRVLKRGSLLFMNFGHLAEDKLRPFKAAQIIESLGFHCNETITWVKNHYRPIQGNKRLNNLTEFVFEFEKDENEPVFLFHKDKMPDLDRMAIGVPYADKSNAKRFACGRDLKCGGNTWYIPYETIQKSAQKLHNDRFPVELPERCIKLSGLKQGVVLDFFGGSGTTGVAAENLGLNYILIEKNPAHIETAKTRLKSNYETITLPGWGA